MMNKKIILLLIPFVMFLQSSGQEKILVKGMKITKSVKIKKQLYKLDASLKMEEGVVVIEGNNIIVDLNNAVLNGSKAMKNSDEFFSVSFFMPGH